MAESPTRPGEASLAPAQLLANLDIEYKTDTRGVFPKATKLRELLTRTAGYFFRRDRGEDDREVVAYLDTEFSIFRHWLTALELECRRAENAMSYHSRHWARMYRTFLDSRRAKVKALVDEGHREEAREFVVRFGGNLVTEASPALTDG